MFLAALTVGESKKFVYYNTRQLAGTPQQFKPITVGYYLLKQGHHYIGSKINRTLYTVYTYLFRCSCLSLLFNHIPLCEQTMKKHCRCPGSDPVVDFLIYGSFIILYCICNTAIVLQL